MKSRLSDPKLMMAMKNLSLSAKTTIDGFMSGIHNSNVKGIGLEFSQYRSYQPGDDLRRLDWKMFARSDRYYIRESEVETSISIKLLIDASASMNHVDKGFTKIEYARYLAACLAYLASLQSDAIGLHVFQNNNLFSLPSQRDHQHLSRIYYQLEKIEPAGYFTEPVHYKNIFSNTKKEMLIFITDYYEQEGELTKLLVSLATNKHEIVVFHILAENEARPDFAGYTSLEDWETGKTIRIDATAIKKTYQEQFDAYLANIKNELHSRNIWYEPVMMNEPLDKAIQQFLIARNKIRR